jgi:formylglycine-generating enzyme required for sulfatase activity
MAVVFLSHSGRDDQQARSLVQWLHASGFTDVFVDHDSIAGGDKWREALRQATKSCRVVICLVTENWLSSSECFGEFTAAWYMGRRIIPLFILPQRTMLKEEKRKRLDRVCGEDQGIDLVDCIDDGGQLNIAADNHVASRLANGLRSAGAITRIGLDPAAFAIDKTICKQPFPGLASFGDDDADAALFYGRSGEIAHVLEDLRSMRALNDVRLLVIQGASGAGKSSLLKAGIIPRLRRESPAWLPLRVFRPGADPLLNFAEAMSRTFADYGQAKAHGLIRDQLRDVWSKADRSEGSTSGEGLKIIQTALELHGELLRAASGRPGATILISIDQAEELARSESTSGEALADYLRAAFTSDQGRWQLVLTVRTDSFAELQKHRRFQNLEIRGYDLRAIPAFRFDSVVEEPAKRYEVEIDVALIDALMEDAPREDALPLLAFALQRLWHQYAASRTLTENHYRSFGGLRGLIEDGAERALRGIEPDQDMPLSERALSPRLDELGRSTFVPALVQINDQGAAIRKTPSWASFGNESQSLLEHFDRWRLVVRKGREELHGGTVEVAHEALFRDWTRLQSWLLPERARLETLRCLHVDAVAWGRQGGNPAYLNHRGERLAEAEELATHAGFSAQIGFDELAYLRACRTAERARRKQECRRKALVAALSAILITVGMIWWNQASIRRQYYWYRMGPIRLTEDNARKYAAQPGRVFAECRMDCPTLVVVQPGQFVMGATTVEDNSESRPPRVVTFVKSFAVGRSELTFAQWDRCAAAGACKEVKDLEGWGRGDRPVNHVSWDDAQQYVLWLSRMTGAKYHLLTEAQWEYAARAGTTGPYSFDEKTEDIQEYAWLSLNSEGMTHPVNGRRANPFGVHDMYGNVSEWCQDSWHDTYEGNPPTDGGEWIGGDSSFHVIRGGAWDSSPRFARSAYRSKHPTADDNASNLGFRVARDFFFD